MLFTQAGFDAGLLAALAWSAVAIGRRVVLRRKIPAILVISTLLLLARTVVGFCTGSAFCTSCSRRCRTSCSRWRCW
ncbi:hypothetical protein ACFQV8_16830 [Pseudonocardia benzenivorans]